MAYAKGTSRVKEISTTSNVTASTYIHKNNKKKNQGNTASQKENSIDIFQQASQNMPNIQSNKEFKLAVLKEHNKLQENLERHINEFKNKKMNK